MNQKIDILIVEPGKEPRLSTVTNDLETLQRIVGGPIEAGCYLPQRVMLICSTDGKNMGLPPNRPNPADSEDAICGTFLLCSFEGERFTPCPIRKGAASGDAPPPAPPFGGSALDWAADKSYGLFSPGRTCSFWGFFFWLKEEDRTNKQEKQNNFCSISLSGGKDNA